MTSNGFLFGEDYGNGAVAAVIHSPPLTSVWEESDGELLEAILSFYPSIKPSPILDATYNTGRIWRGTNRRVVSMDIDPRYNPDIVGDNHMQNEGNEWHDQ